MGATTTLLWALQILDYIHQMTTDTYLGGREGGRRTRREQR